MEAATPTIVVVDDAAEVRALLRTRLRLSGGLQVVAEGTDGAEAVELVARHRRDLLLLDVSMPGVDGLEALPRVLAASPRTRVVLYSGFEEEGLAQQAVHLGASAFVEESVPVPTLVRRSTRSWPRSRDRRTTRGTTRPPTPCCCGTRSGSVRFSRGRPSGWPP